MKNILHLLVCLILLVIFFSSCTGGNKRVDDENILRELKNYIGDSVKITHDGRSIYLSVNSQAITDVRREQSKFFSYEQYGSTCALLAGRQVTDVSVENIRVKITDSVFVSEFSYKMDDLRKVNEKIETVFEFSDAIVGEGLNEAKKYFSEEILSMSVDSFNNYFYKRYFSYGQFVDWEILAFRISKQQNVGIFVEYVSYDGRKQTYVLLFELYGDKRIIDIHLPTSSTFRIH